MRKSLLYQEQEEPQAEGTAVQTPWCVKSLARSRKQVLAKRTEHVWHQLGLYRSMGQIIQFHPKWKEVIKEYSVEEWRVWFWL